HPDGTFTYTPDADFAGTDSFKYSASDGLSSSTYATAIITVLPTVQFTSAAYTADASSGSATITVTLGAAFAETATVLYTTTDGTRVAGTDYVQTDGTLTFTPGQTSATFTVPFLDDGIPGDSKTVGLTLYDPGDAALGAPVDATLTIVDSTLP